jgi:hypothetical protein
MQQVPYGPSKIFNNLTYIQTLRVFCAIEDAGLMSEDIREFNE